MAEAILLPSKRAWESPLTLGPTLHGTPHVRAGERQEGQKQTELGKGGISSGGLPGPMQKTSQCRGWRGEWSQRRKEDRRNMGFGQIHKLKHVNLRKLRVSDPWLLSLTSCCFV